MTEDYVSDLLILRDVQVNERRRLVRKAIDDSAEANDLPGGAATLGQDVMEQQQLIDAIDRAIADESKLTHKASTKPEGTETSAYAPTGTTRPGSPPITHG